MHNALHKVAQPPKLTREQRRDLSIETGFFEGLYKVGYHRYDPRILELLAQNSSAIADVENLQKYLKDFITIETQRLKAGQGDQHAIATAYYDLACSYSVQSLKQKDNALLRLSANCLIKALDNGYEQYRKIMADRDLTTLRHSAFFKAVRSRLVA